MPGFKLLLSWLPRAKKWLATWRWCTLNNSNHRQGKVTKAPKRLDLILLHNKSVHFFDSFLSAGLHIVKLLS